MDYFSSTRGSPDAPDDAEQQPTKSLGVDPTSPEIVAWMATALAEAFVGL
jgi:hypothetical protein